MYPRISDIFIDLFGFELPFPIYSFGFMVAVGLMTGAWLLQRELDRLHSLGRIDSITIDDPEEKKSGKKGRAKKIQVSPSYLVGTMTMLAIAGGFSGAKLFHILENLDDFFRDPIGMVFSSGGFTFYGGLIMATLLIARYVKKKGLSVAQVADAIAPGLMLAYGVGRIGCQLSGDGDWGIAANIAAKPDWLPMWLWAETYQNNILNIDLSAAPVYPTPIYEFIAAALLFGLLYRFRNHTHLAGWLFWFYIAVNGIERFFIEKIRVNNRFDLFGITLTQAELIALAFVLVGVIGMWKFWGSREQAGASGTLAHPDL
jgi:phosphatidylglycerol:prolipoprotein diacylglycerol transferase